MLTMDVNEIDSKSAQNRAFLIANFALGKQQSFTTESLMGEIRGKLGVWVTYDEVQSRLDALVGFGLLMRRYPNLYVVRDIDVGK